MTIHFKTFQIEKNSVSWTFYCLHLHDTVKPASKVEAHRGHITTLCFDEKGTLLASCCTFFRVFIHLFTKLPIMELLYGKFLEKNWRKCGKIQVLTQAWHHQSVLDEKERLTFSCLVLGMEIWRYEEWIIIISLDMGYKTEEQCTTQDNSRTPRKNDRRESDSRRKICDICGSRLHSQIVDYVR